MRIAYLLPDPGIPVGGTKGASIHVAEACSALHARGCTVLLVAMSAAGDPPPGVELVHLDSGPLPKGAEGESQRLAAVERFLRRAESTVAAFDADLIYERFSLFAGDGGALAARLRIPRLVEVNAPVAAERARHFGLTRRAVAEALERRALAGASVIAVSQPLTAWALERGAARVRVVPNGANVDRFAPERIGGQARAVRSALELDRAEVIGFAGSLKPWHGVHVLLEAAGRLAAVRPLLRVLIVGDGPLLPALQAGIPEPLLDRVRFTGAVPGSAVPAHVGAFDIATAPYLPSDDFYFSPLKVVEAMAAARPVVASRFPSIERMLGATGRLVQPGDPVALAGALADLLDHPSATREMARAARSRACARFTWTAVAEQILAAAGAAACPSPIRRLKEVG